MESHSLNDSLELHISWLHGTVIAFMIGQLPHVKLWTRARTQFEAHLSSEGSVIREDWVCMIELAYWKFTILMSTNLSFLESQKMSLQPSRYRKNIFLWKLEEGWIQDIRECHACTLDYWIIDSQIMQVFLKGALVSLYKNVMHCAAMVRVR